MNSNELTITNVNSSVTTPVTNVIVHETHAEVFTDTFSVRFEKVGDEFQNGDFTVDGDLSAFAPAVAEPAEETVADEATETAADTTAETAAVDPAAEGGDTTVETTVEAPAAGEEGAETVTE